MVKIYNKSNLKKERIFVSTGIDCSLDDKSHSIHKDEFYEKVI